MSQNSFANYFKIKVTYPVMICNSVLYQGVVWCDQILFWKEFRKRSYFVENKQ